MKAARVRVLRNHIWDMTMGLLRKLCLAFLVIVVTLFGLSGLVAQEASTSDLNAAQIASLVERACATKPEQLLQMPVGDALLSATISNDGQRVGVLTTEGVEVFEVMQSEKERRSFKVELSRPADIRIVDDSRVAIWTTRKFLLVDLIQQKILLKLEPKPEEQRFVGWATSTDGFGVLVIAANATRYILGLNDSSGNIETAVEETKVGRSSQAISSDLKRVATLLRKGKVAISNQDLSPPNHIGIFEDAGFVPGQTKLAASNRFLCIINADTINVLPIPGQQVEVSPVMASGDLVCLFLQMGSVSGSERVFATLRSTFSDEIHLLTIAPEISKVYRSWKLNTKDPHSLVWSESGERLCYTTRTNVVVLQTPALFTGALEPAMKVVSETLLASQDVANLRRIEEKLIPTMDAETSPFARWHGHLTGPVLADAREQDQLPQWIGRWRKAYPESKMARLIAADWHTAKAWMNRGDGFVGGKTDSQLNEFREHLLEARAILGDLPTEQIPPIMLQHALEISKGLGGDDPNQERLIDLVCEQFPAYTSAHIKVLEMKLPRWGGSVSQVEDYINRVARLQPKEESDQMYATLALGLIPYFGTPKFFETFQVDFERVVKGAAQIDLSKGEVSRGYRDLMVNLAMREAWEEVRDLLANHGNTMPLFFQSYRLKGTASLLRKKLLQLPDVGKQETESAFNFAEKSLLRRIRPASENVGSEDLE